MKKLVLASLLSASLSTAVAAPFVSTGNDVSSVAGIDASQYESFDDIVMQYMEYQEATSGTVGVVKDGRLVLARSYGIAKQAENLQTHPDNIFRVASLGKTLSAIAITKLAQDGLLDLDGQVFGAGGILENVVIPDGGSFDNSGYDSVIKEQALYEDITVRDILQHRSGMSHSYDPMFDHNRIRAELGLDHPPSCNEMANYYTGRYPLNAVSGRTSAYSNIGYCVAHLIVEEVSGQAYDTYLQENIFQENSVAALSRSLPEDRVDHEVDYISTYSTKSVFDPSVYVPVADGGFYSEGGGGMATSAKDFLHLIATILGPVNDQSLLTDASVAELLSVPEQSKKEDGCFDIEATNDEHVAAGRATFETVQECTGYWFWQTCTDVNTYVAKGSNDDLGSSGSTLTTLNTTDSGSSFNDSACPVVNPYQWSGLGVGVARNDDNDEKVVWNIGGVPGTQAQFVRWIEDDLMWFMAFNIETRFDTDDCRLENGGSFNGDTFLGTDFDNDADHSWICHQDPMMQKARRQIDVTNYPTYDLFDKDINAQAPGIEFSTITNGNCDNIVGQVTDDRWVKQLEIFVSGQWEPVHLELSQFTTEQCVDQGDSTVYLRATDDHGLQTEVQVYTGPIDYRPVVTIDNTSTNVDCIYLEGTASDDDTLVSVEYVLDGVTYPVDSLIGDQWTASQCGLSDRNYPVSARATDNAEQSSETETQVVRLSNQGPDVLEFNVVVDGDCINVSGSMYDVNGIAKVQVAIDGNYQNAVKNANLFEYEECGFGVGTYGTSVKVTDYANDENEVYGPNAVVETVTPVCVTADNLAHISEGRAVACTIYYSPHACAEGSGTDLGFAASYYSQTSTLLETSPGYWEKVSSCP